jgi:hypothetical protein
MSSSGMCHYVVLVRTEVLSSLIVFALKMESDTVLQNVGSYKSHTALHTRR